MTDYTNNFNGDTKDGANSIILGVDFDTEFDSLVTHVATKSNKVGSATVNNIMTMTSAGDLKDSGQTIAQLLASTPLTGAPTLGGSDLVDAFPQGTDMLFYQTAAPTGWTKNTTASLNDHALRIMTSGSWTGGTQGTTAFSTQFAQSFAGENYTLLEADTPAHTHGNSGAHVHNSFYKTGAGKGANAPTGSNDIGNPSSTEATSSTTHEHTSFGGAGAHKHDVNLGVKYLDMIIASKD